MERGTHDELVKKPKGVYAGMWGKQQSHGKRRRKLNGGAIVPPITPPLARLDRKTPPTAVA